MENANLKNALTELFYSLPISEEKSFDEWFNEQRIINYEILEYYLEDGYVVTKNVISVKDKYFQFEIVTLDLSNHVGLVITDFTTADDKEDAILLWNSQVETLCRIGGM